MNWDALAPLGRIFVILGLPLGLYAVVHGVKNGLIRKRILSRKNPDSYAVGTQAVILGLIYIVFGMFLVISGTVGLILILKCNDTSC